jgi:hypothetical protein
VKLLLVRDLKRHKFVLEGFFHFLCDEELVRELVLVRHQLIVDVLRALSSVRL